MTDQDSIDQLIERVGRSRFRAKFRLYGRDRAIVDLRGIDTIRVHADRIIGERVAPSAPRNDGRQTPYRGHPVFVAQHATGTCCRTCLARCHGIPAGAALTVVQRGYVVDVICRWIVLQYLPDQPPP